MRNKRAGWIIAVIMAAAGCLAGCGKSDTATETKTTAAETDLKSEDAAGMESEDGQLDTDSAGSAKEGESDADSLKEGSDSDMEAGNAPATETESEQFSSSENKRSMKGSGENADGAKTADAAKTELSFWTYPIGGFGDEEQIQELVDDFRQEYPDVAINVKLLDYSTGDSEIAEAVANGEAPDLVIEGPERLVANWGDSGLMVDLNDLWEEENAQNMYVKVSAACHNLAGNYYEYPLCMMVHTMALNKDVFEAAGALKYLDEETGTWKSSDFIEAVKTVHEYLKKQGNTEGRVGVIYCKDQGGDQGTRALVTNLNSGMFTNAAHTEYTVDSKENLDAISTIVSLQDSGLAFDSEMNGGDEIKAFCSGDIPMAFCWNCNAQKSNMDTGFEILPVTFPSDDGIPELCGGIYGFGIFDNGDAEKIEAAKDFIRFLTSDPEEYKKAVRMANGFPVMDTLKDDDLTDLYEQDDAMNQFIPFMQYFGDYYQVVPGWPEARAAWWQMLQEIGAGSDMEESVDIFMQTVGTAVEKARG